MVSERQVVPLVLLLSLGFLFLLGFDQIILLPDQSDKFLGVDTFLGIFIDFIHMPLNEGIGERIPRPWQRLCNDTFEKHVAYQLVVIAKES